MISSSRVISREGVMTEIAEPQPSEYPDRSARRLASNRNQQRFSASVGVSSRAVRSSSFLTLLATELPRVLAREPDSRTAGAEGSVIFDRAGYSPLASLASGRR